ncbi:60S ribosomal protein L29 [Lemmus lemmus]
MQGRQGKGHGRSTEASKAPVKPQVPKGSSRTLSRLVFIAHPKLGKQIRSYMAKGRRLQKPKPKVQTKAKASAPAQAPKSAQVSVKAP